MLIGWCGSVSCDMDCRYCPMFDREEYDEIEDDVDEEDDLESFLFKQQRKEVR